ncbi:hypothetical protein PAXRUDRAFT_19039 [Paxillus rubicundulus Ve08.2h10]|uniref:Uncharacterized protein n=1 Tax=Paxillus rubicundulus Ve08.2h10 TaxID=930991 RepID=A0A0D0CJM7_9AGAM|nr:hypothetical protein PAXRUDRAFT_19039 [Paxillus rubicundulus Ve08.2h10]
MDRLGIKGMDSMEGHSRLTSTCLRRSIDQTETRNGEEDERSWGEEIYLGTHCLTQDQEVEDLDTNDKHGRRQHLAPLEPDEEGQSSSKRQCSAIDKSLFPWGPTSIAIRDTLAPEHQQVLNILVNWSNDPTFVVQKILLTPGAPNFPPDQWTNIVKGLAVDLNKILGAHYSLKPSKRKILETYRTSKQSKIVWTHGDWVIAFGKTLQATVFALPQRSAEYAAWQTYISQLFASVQFSQHERVIEFDKAARLCVAKKKTHSPH